MEAEDNLPALVQKKCRYCMASWLHKYGEEEQEVTWRFLFGRILHRIAKFFGKKCGQETRGDSVGSTPCGLLRGSGGSNPRTPRHFLLGGVIVLRENRACRFCSWANWSIRTSVRTTRHMEFPKRTTPEREVVLSCDLCYRAVRAFLLLSAMWDAERRS